MTENTLESQPEVPNIVIRTITILMMLIGLAVAGYLLKWAVLDKFAKGEVAESSDITAAVRDRQLACLAKNIYFEAGSEPFEGQVAVAQVTLNRANSGKFPADVCEVVYQKNGILCQFSWYCSIPNNAVRPINSKMFDESMIVAKKVLLEGFRLPSLSNALYFHNTQISPNWNKKRIAQIGGHIFYE